MITIWKQNGKGVIQTSGVEPNCWVHVACPTPLEMERLIRDYKIEPDALNDILDVDERSRVEREESYQLIIVRIPVYDPNNEVPYFTIPLGIFLVDDIIITVCLRELAILRDFMDNRIRDFDLHNRRTFLLHLFNRSATSYLKYLKEINKQTSFIERDLQRSIKNNELIHLLTMEKSLVYFTTSLKSNDFLLKKLSKGNLLNATEEETDLLEDVATELEQAIEMANIYSNILSGMMDAFASVISNNINVVMKQLTSISIVLMIPTLIASIYGMNVGIPYQHSPFAFAGIVVVSLLSSAIGAIYFLRKRFV
ncbi:MAG TPA: magnesium transporter CorA family protein [Spirochaetia bacterium]|nr:magnesium transporter CorA family protein [Spirochaetia bacterium]